MSALHPDRLKNIRDALHTPRLPQATTREQTEREKLAVDLARKAMAARKAKQQGVYNLG